MTYDWSISVLLVLSFLAGLIDAIAGGGGLIQLPALLAILPNIPVPQLMGTNKLASLAGTSIATWNYTRKIKLELNVLLYAAIFAFCFSFVGSLAVSVVNPLFLKPVIFVLLAVVLFYTVTNKNIEELPQLKINENLRLRLGVALGSLIGFYDGFVGPGTGSFLIVLFVTVFGANFLAASASAKIVNLGTNLASLAWFLPSGNILWKIAIPMAICNFIGGRIGSRLAISRGNYFVRSVFILVVSILILKMGYDLILNW